MNYGPETLTKLTLLHRCRADAACPLTRWQHFSARNDVIGAGLEVWRQIENPTTSIDTYLLEEKSCQISPRSDLKRRNLGLFEEVAQKRRTTRTRTRWVPDPKMAFALIRFRSDIYINRTDNILVCLFCLTVVQNHVVNGRKVLTGSQQCGRTVFLRRRHCCYWWRWCWRRCWIWTASTHVRPAASSDAVSIYVGYYRLAVKLNTFIITTTPRYQI